METPTMASSMRASSYYNIDKEDKTFGGLKAMDQMINLSRRLQAQPVLQMHAETLKEVPMNQRRIVQVFIADTNQNVPLNSCLIYKGEEKLTDATDQELFFEINIKELLDVHNEARVKIVDKTVKDRTEYLEPAKIRDLKMAVVTVTIL